jgi:ribosome-interacting GTPase 1
LHLPLHSLHSICPPAPFHPPQEYRIHNCELLFKEDIGVDDLIDLIEGNRRYVKCLYVYNKVRARE